MAHPTSGSDLRSRVPATNGDGLRRPESFADKSPLLDEEALMSKHQMMEEKTLEIELEHAEEERREKERLCFRDGERFIDYVIVHETPLDDSELKEEEKEELREKLEKRGRFEKNLQEAGLEIEYEDEVTTKDDEMKTHFLKVHAPWDTLCKTAEEMMMQMPIKESDIHIANWYEKHIGKDIRDMITRNNPFEIHDSSISNKPNYFMGYFMKEHLDMYVGHEHKETFFSRTERSRIVEHICSKVRFGEERYDVGIKKLLHEQCYVAAYPLHPGPEDSPEDEQPTNSRQKLRREWARFGRWFKFQPYNAIMDYFGTEIGFYFSWLGFYTVMLIPPAIFGIIVFLYGISNANNFKPVEDVCNESNERLFYMCPLCDAQCPYWSLTSSCYYAVVAHALDNDLTVAFAIFMSVWATLFLEFWKRRQVVLSYHWHMMHFEDLEEQFRPEFIATAPTWRKDKVTGKVVPHVPKKTRYQKFAGVGSVVSFMIFLVLAAVVGVVAYRASVFGALVSSGSFNARKNAKFITSITAALLNLVCINLLKFIYERLAVWLTNWENPPTETDYKDSFTYKMFLFQFVNTYSSIFYIAFFKLNYVVGTPGNYQRLAGGRLDGCGVGGCLLDLFIQLVIIMVGQQIIGNITEIAIPGLMKWWKLRQARKEIQDIPQWEEDYKLSALPEHHMFWEYLEVVLQFGFVTMFVAAFPLAPLFAMLNCVMEIRVDAVNFVCQFRRPVARRAQDIGAWYRIMESITNLSVLVNAFVISFTSDFIPRLVYRSSYSSDGTLTGYVNSSLSYFNVSDWDAREKPRDQYAYQVLNYSMPFCRYPGYRIPNEPYDVNKQYWHVIAARLAFVFVFQYVVYSITKFIAWLVPDRPKLLDLKIRREEFLAKQALRQREVADIDPGVIEVVA
ncbi:anoctamin-4-like [Montipora capricornis]|uniref:anoctamin-4-like n=1 Tax=Montipora capricornis TaxID=246305 RepID=UPI0035F1D73E